MGAVVVAAACGVEELLGLLLLLQIKWAQQVEIVGGPWAACALLGANADVFEGVRLVGLGSSGSVVLAPQVLSHCICSL